MCRSPFVLALLVACCLAAPAACAETYKCKEHGTTTFQDKPCSGPGGEVVVIKNTEPPRPLTSGSPDERAAQISARMSEIDVEIADLERGYADMNTEFATRKSGPDAPAAGSESGRKLEAQHQHAIAKWQGRIKAAKKRREALAAEDAAIRAALDAQPQQ